MTEVGRRAYVAQLMGMPISVHLRGPRPDAAPAQAAVERLFDELREVDRVFSLYRDDSDLSRLTRGELTLDGCHPDVAAVAALCEQARARTDGWFDPRLPGPDGIRRWDPTGLVKGWAVERAARALGERLAAELPGHDHCVNAGGDVAAGTARADGPPWRIGIENPADRSTLLDVAEVRTGAVATSGTAARGAHIVDPFTGAPTTALLAVTVTGPSLLWADVYATAGFARGSGAATWLTGLEDHSALVVDGAATVTRIRWARTLV